MNQQKIIACIVWTSTLLLVGLILILTIRGLSGVPRAETLSSDIWLKHGPLELSPERGRFALLYSIVENRSLSFSLPVAKLAVPDLAINAAGEYVSLFAPAVSFIAVPGYLVGKILGASQVGAYAVIAFFAFLNFMLIRAIALRFGAEPWAALLGALTFALATPALPYAGTLYQHHISVALLLVSIWTLVRFRNIWSLAVVWFACALSVVVDNPNFFLMFPVGVFGLVRLRQLIAEIPTRSQRAVQGIFSIIVSVAVVLLPLGFFAWYNLAAYGNPFQLPGTLQSVSEIGSDGRPAAVNLYEKTALSLEQLASLSQEGSNEKTAIGFFDTRNLYDGFYTPFVSLDRSILAFTPVILIGLTGLVLLYRRHQNFAALLIACIGTNVVLYSMWGDPWGGWAFGSRYLIPTYALLAIATALALSWWRFSLVTVCVFIPLFIFSLWVNTLGAVTTIANPPEVQVLALEKQSNHEEKYTFMRNWEYLNRKYPPAIGSKAFVYQLWGKHMMTPRQYHGIVFALGLLALVIALVSALLSSEKVSNWIRHRRV